MGRPKKHDDRVTTAVRLPPEVKARLDAEADARDIGANVLMTRAIVDYLDRLVPVDEVLATRPPVSSSRDTPDE